LYEEREQAREELCRTYWRPLFAVLSHRGFDIHDAEDLTQGFLLHFIESNAAARADPRKGRFRDFLVGALNHYLNDVQASTQAVKRGGGAIPLSLDDRDSAQIDSLLPWQSAAHADSDRAWAAALLDSVLEELETRYCNAGDGRLFRLLKPYLTDEKPQSYWQLSLRLRRRPATLRSDVKRLRRQYRMRLRAKLQKRVGMERVEEELENLREILRER
jgi:RNA polymerase sigma-70 factor (ECF subfamily)